MIGCLAADSATMTGAGPKPVPHFGCSILTGRPRDGTISRNVDHSSQRVVRSEGYIFSSSFRRLISRSERCRGGFCNVLQMMN